VRWLLGSVPGQTLATSPPVSGSSTATTTSTTNRLVWLLLCRLVLSRVWAGVWLVVVVLGHRPRVWSTVARERPPVWWLGCWWYWLTYGLAWRERLMTKLDAVAA